MNRRQFTASLSALIATPAVPFSAKAATTVVPAKARFWAIYMSHLNGSCSPHLLSQITGESAVVTKGYLNSLISQNIIKPTRIAANAIGGSNKTIADQSQNAFEKVKSYVVENDETLDLSDESDTAVDNEDTVGPVDDTAILAEDPAQTDVEDAKS
jgi:hypothetical protein